MSHPGLEQNKSYFRSIADLENTPEFEQFLHREFPQAASEFPEGVSRRRWIQLMGASLALGGVAGCRYNKEEIAAFVVRPEGRIAGLPEYFATNFEWAGRVVHVLATNVDGRPIKIDGNPEHPLNAAVDPSEFKDGKEKKFTNAGCDVLTQGAILSLYDPERLDVVLSKGNVSTWADAEKAIADSLKGLEGAQGKGLAVVFEPTNSPSLQRALAEVKAKLPQAMFVAYDPVDRSAEAKALAAAGAKGRVQLKLDSAKVIAAIDADLFGTDPSAMLYARQFAKGRTPNGSHEMNRLYSVESQYSVTGGAADFRLALRSSHVAPFLSKLEAAIDSAKGGKKLDASGETPFSELSEKQKVQRTIEVMATDLVANQGASLVVVGPFQSAEAQQAGLRINAKLGNFGKTLHLLDSASMMADVETTEFSAFLGKASAGEVKVAWVLGANPVFSAPGDLKVADALAKIETSIYLGDDDETAAACSWVLPASHPLESWGDARATDGTYGVCQPLISVLKNGRSQLEVLSLLAGLPETDSQRFVMATAEKISGGTLSKRQWKDILHAGFLAGSQFKPSSAAVSAEGSIPDAEIDTESIEQGKLEVAFYPSDSLYDGRLANNGWLQELPQPITKLTWDNAAVVSPKTAKVLGLVQGEKVRLKHEGSSIELPVFIVPGQAEGSIAAHLGYGRTRCGIVGKEVGHNVNPIRGSKKGWVLTGVEAKGTTIPYKLATTQDHFTLDTIGLRATAYRSPQLIREGTLKQFTERESFAPDTYKPHHANESMWREPINRIEEEQPYLPQWGMTVDLNKCVGCNACVVACQAENNVPIVGKDQVSRGREMHWLRLDRYFQCDFDKTTDFQNPVDVKMVHQPLACVHCETAPCEQVCPVAATVHTEEGINAMAYNRCIGTRYCGNNCPYKVRRFNYYNFNTKYGYFYGWQDERETTKTKLQSLVLNPEVTVRGRGVMEKCTYCIQRVQNGKIKSRQTGDGKIHDGDIKTACQDACPTQAIVFGDITDKESRVYKLQNSPRGYELLGELNVKPRTIYLARLRNVPERLMTRTQLHPPEIHDHHDHGSDEGGHDHSEAKKT